MKNTRIRLLSHYRKLLFFNFNRFKGDNYRLMREYLASILISEIEKFMPITNKKVLDIGGGRGEFCKILYEKRKCDAINLEPHPKENIIGWDIKLKKEKIWPKTRVGFADKIPFGDNKFDLVICRGVLEHIPTNKQQKSMNEMYRVTKKNGFCYIMIPPRYNPHAGHLLKPFHIFPFKLAKFLRQLFFRNKIKANSYAEAHLYPITFKRMLKMISLTKFKIVGTKDTHFRLHFLTKIPLVREIMVPAVAFILKKE